MILWFVDSRGIRETRGIRGTWGTRRTRGLEGLEGFDRLQDKTMKNKDKQIAQIRNLKQIIRRWKKYGFFGWQRNSIQDKYPNIHVLNTCLEKMRRQPKNTKISERRMFVCRFLIVANCCTWFSLLCLKTQIIKAFLFFVRNRIHDLTPLSFVALMFCYCVFSMCICLWCLNLVIKAFLCLFSLYRVVCFMFDVFLVVNTIHTNPQCLRRACCFATDSIA